MPDGKNPKEDRYHGFSLQSVCWGYREIFSKAIENLFDEGLIGPERKEVTSKFFELMNCSGEYVFDHILKEFLGALNPQTRWIMDLPGVFGDVVDLGRRFSESKIYYGSAYFRILGEGGFGNSPQQVRDLMTCLRRLREIDEELSLAFLKGYRYLSDRLEPEEINLYVDEGLKIFAGNRKGGLSFMEGTVKSSENIIRMLTRECRLEDVEPVMVRLLKALVGYEVEISHLGDLDSDALIERGTSTVCMYKWLYMPHRIRYFDSQRDNRRWYLLITVVAAGMLSENSFCRIHGHPDYVTCADLVGDDLLRLNIFQILEYVRVLRTIRRQWPGARGLVDFGLETEFEKSPPRTPADILFRDAISPHSHKTNSAKTITDIADRSANVFDTASSIQDVPISEILQDYPGLDKHPLRTFAFLPDFLYPGTVSSPPSDRLVANLKQASRRNNRETPDGEGAACPPDVSESQDGSNNKENERPEEEAPIDASFAYDEWNQHENDYYRDHCLLRERTAVSADRRTLPPDTVEASRRVRRVFELLKPDIARREKYLREGDYINPDILLRYLVQRRNEPSPKVNFYEKPVTAERDLSVLVLIDVSGSTGEEIESKKTIDIEKHAAIILGQGLVALGDRFSVCGFSGNGRENCEYIIYKDFEENWGKEPIGRLLAAYPMSSTRIGPALRHSGYRLSKVAAKQRLIILITDGKPMDSGYDPATRYAQFDVRMACQENIRQYIHTFGISTEENSVADMEIMFPNRRFVILSDIRRLPDVLPRMYVRMTI